MPNIIQGVIVLQLTESSIERNLRNRIQALGGLCLKIPTVFMCGFPDRLVLLPGGIVKFVELKRPKAQLQAVQAKRFKQLIDLGFDVRMLDTPQKVMRFVEEVSNAKFDT